MFRGSLGRRGVQLEAMASNLLAMFKELGFGWDHMLKIFEHGVPVQVSYVTKCQGQYTGAQ